MDLFLRLAEVGRIVNLPDPLLKYREHLEKAGRVRAGGLEQYSRYDRERGPETAGDGAIASE